MISRLLQLLLFTAVLFPGVVQAQDQQQDEQDAAQQEQQEEQAEAQEEESGDVEEEEVEEEDENEFERFVPTEQVSRDLGVSFPADI